MNAEIQNGVQSLRMPLLKIQRVEEIYPAVLRGGMVSALFRESHFIVLFRGFMGPKKSKYFFRKLLLNSSFSIVLAFDDIFSYANVLMHSFFLTFRMIL
jgi:hypothetical protein